MRVIEKYNPNKKWSAEVMCRGCKDTLLVDEDDLRQDLRIYSDNDDDGSYFVTFKCSECGVINDLMGTNFEPTDLPILER